MKIKVDNEKNRVYIKGKEFAIITDYNDPEFGHILKCCTLKFKDYAVFFISENNGNYMPITDEETFKKIAEKYETKASTVIID